MTKTMAPVNYRGAIAKFKAYVVHREDGWHKLLEAVESVDVQ